MYFKHWSTPPRDWFEICVWIMDCILNTTEHDTVDNMYVQV